MRKMFEFSADLEAADYKIEIAEDEYGRLKIMDDFSVSDLACTDIQMREDPSIFNRKSEYTTKQHKQKLPSERDIKQTTQRIHSLSRRQSFMSPQEKSEFLDNIKSAEGLLRNLRSDLNHGRLPTSEHSREKISGKWLELVGTLSAAEAAS